jgi:hypothetical protein
MASKSNVRFYLVLAVTTLGLQHRCLAQFTGIFKE